MTTAEAMTEMMDSIETGAPPSRDAKVTALVAIAVVEARRDRESSTLIREITERICLGLSGKSLWDMTGGERAALLDRLNKLNEGKENP